MDRLALLGMLPEKGNFITLKIVRELRESLVPSEEEIKELEIVELPETEQIRWSDEKDVGKNIKVGEVARNLIKKLLIELDEKEELEQRHEPLYEIFVK